MHFVAFLLVAEASKHLKVDIGIALFGQLASVAAVVLISASLGRHEVLARDNMQ